MPLRLALNRTCAPQLPLTDFLALAVAAGAQAVEIRNDIEGREFADGTPAAEVRARVDGAGLAIASVNALQRFNDWSPARAVEAERIISYAAALGAPGVVLCPVHDPGHGWSEAESARNLRTALQNLRPILMDHGMIGYVEPLGMRGSTLTRQDVAVAAVSDVDGWDVYQLCFDTFQYYRCGDSAVFPDRIGLVHISGIPRADLAPGDLNEPDRGLVFLDDRVGNIGQLRALRAAGYDGLVSMEPFSPSVQSDPQLAARLRASLDFVVAASRAGQ